MPDGYTVKRRRLVRVDGAALDHGRKKSKDTKKSGGKGKDTKKKSSAKAKGKAKSKNAKKSSTKIAA